MGTILAYLKILMSQFRLRRLQKGFQTLGLTDTADSMILSRAYPSKVQLEVISSFPLEVQARLFTHHAGIEIFAASRAQIGQDLLALLVHFANTESPRDGLRERPYFVEFGACDGIAFSNTWILEKYFGWNGILAEPGLSYQRNLNYFRESSKISHSAVTSQSGQRLTFFENLDKPSLSGLQASEENSLADSKFVSYEVETVSIQDLLDKFKAPKRIQFLSIDTEGNELPILQSLDFSKYSFDLVAIEVASRMENKGTTQFMDENGYRHLRQLAEISGGDSWYVHSEVQGVNHLL
jgi:FkbM family methyltransferase